MALGAAGALAAAGCASLPPVPETPWPSRFEYEAFRARHPLLLEPNYLPFMTEHVRVDEGPAPLVRTLRAWLGRPAPPPRDYLVFCHWSAEQFPVRVYVEPPVVPEDLRDAAARPPEAYVAAVERAFRLWENALDGLVSFRRVPRAQGADVRLRLVARERPEDAPGIQVLGTTRVGGACRYRGGDPATGRIEVDFRVPELTVHVVDRFGLLLPDQVEKIALHELGHALGMPRHSPIPADLMFRVLRDRLPRGELGAEDVNSFLSLYSLPSGTLYRRLPGDEEAGSRAPILPEGPPRLALAPHVDVRLGYEIQLPEGWTWLDSGVGVVAVDGTTWDYEASLQVSVRSFESLEGYLERYGAWHLGRGRPLGPLRRVDGRYAGRRVAIATREDRLEELVLLESGDGRVVVVLFDCPLESAEVWRPWLDASLATLELRTAREAPRDRDYATDGEGDPPVR